MESQKKQLEDALQQSGWRIAEREQISSDWWADEIWTIESTWSPMGRTLFLTFLVDLMQSGTRRPGENVTAIGCSVTRPRHREEAAGEPLIYLRPSWEKNLPGFVSRLKELRDRKSTRLNSSHSQISYAVFCLKKKTKNIKN